MKVRELMDLLDGYNLDLPVIVEGDSLMGDFVVDSVEGTEVDGEQVVCLYITKEVM